MFVWLQTRNAGDVAGIPRFINLKEYVPGDGVTLEDWVVREATRVRQYNHTKMYIHTQLVYSRKIWLEFMCSITTLCRRSLFLWRHTVKRKRKGMILTMFLDISWVAPPLDNPQDRDNTQTHTQYHTKLLSLTDLYPYVSYYRSSCVRVLCVCLMSLCLTSRF